MSYWAEIKSLVNADLGKEDFLSIDKLIMFSKEYIVPSKFDGRYDSLVVSPIASWAFESAPTKNIKFKALTNGYVLMYLNFRSPTSPTPLIRIYNGENLVKEFSGGTVAEFFTLKIFKGDTITIRFENASSYANGGEIEIYGELVNHYGLREVHQ